MGTLFQQIWVCISFDKWIQQWVKLNDTGRNDLPNNEAAFSNELGSFTSIVGCRLLLLLFLCLLLLPFSLSMIDVFVYDKNLFGRTNSLPLFLNIHWFHFTFVYLLRYLFSLFFASASLRIPFDFSLSDWLDYFKYWLDNSCNIFLFLFFLFRFFYIGVSVRITRT